MKVSKWTTVDVYYNRDEQNEADKEGKRLTRLGYELQEQDAGDGVEFEYCDQYIKSGKTRELKTK